MGVILSILLWLAVAVMLYGNAFVRTRMEAAINRQLQGYTVQLPRLDLHLFGFSVTLRDVVIAQDAHPKPPIAYFPALHAGVDWRALLHGGLKARFSFDEPELHIDLTHLKKEAADKTKMSERGWQRAAQEIYPLEINRFQVHNGEVTYIDKDPKKPMRIERLYVDLQNIRNVRSAAGTYPSPLHVQAHVFGSGRLDLTGHADLLAEPFAAIDADFRLDGVPLAAVNPVAKYAHVEIGGGVLSANGHVEFSPKVQDVRVQKVVLDGLHVAYVHTKRTEAKEEKQLAKVAAVARDVSNEPRVNVEVDDLHIANAELAYVDKERNYRLSFADADLRVRRLTSHADPQPASLMFKGRFMNAGTTVISSEFRPVNKKPEFKLTLQIEDTPLTAMNDLFRAYGNFDAAKGSFAFYAELEARDGRIDGYVKPVFADVEVYTRRQDSFKPILNQVYEGLVGSITGLLRNPVTDVATAADVSGQIDKPNVSTLQIVLRLIQNAFFGSILPGFENEAERSLAPKS